MGLEAGIHNKNLFLHSFGTIKRDTYLSSKKRM